MGGGNALAAAAEDPRVAAAISQVPFLDMVRQAHRSSPLVARADAAGGRPRRTPAGGGTAGRAGLHQRPRRRGRLAPGRRRRRGLALAQPRLLALAAGRSLPAGAARRQLHCPWLLCVGEADRVARPGPAIAAARRAPRGELRTYPGVDHFDIYDGPEFEAVVADEVAFLRRHLAPAPPPRSPR